MMRDPIEYFLSAEITLSDKLLEVLYLIIGLICIYTAIANLRDKGNQKRYGTFVFWCTLGLMFVLGPWIPSLYTGILMCVMVAVPILHRVSRGTQPDPSEEEAEKNYRKIGMKVFIPALSIGVFALAAALFTSISPLVGMGVGVFAAVKQNGKYLLASPSGKAGQIVQSDYQSLLAKYNQSHGNIGA